MRPILPALSSCLLVFAAMSPPLVAGRQPATAPAPSPMQALIERYAVDRGTLASVYTDPFSPATRERMARFDAETQKQLEAIDFAALDQEGKADYLLMDNYLTRASHVRALEDDKWKAAEPLLPFTPTIFALEDARLRGDRPDGETVAAQLNAIGESIAAEQKRLEAGPDKDSAAPDRIAAWRAADNLDLLRGQLQHWFAFYDGYDPAFTWWVAQPYKQADAAMKDYADFLRQKVAGIAPGDEATVIGTPVGRAALVAGLADEMIPYTPEELIAMAKEQMAWCKQQMLLASREMGYGDDWHKALEQVKNSYVEPGKQPELIRDLAVEGEEFAVKNDLVTVPPLAADTWRMEMMTPERQRDQSVLYGRRSAERHLSDRNDDRGAALMGMRGNNPSISRAPRRFMK